MFRVYQTRVVYGWKTDDSKRRECYNFWIRRDNDDANDETRKCDRNNNDNNLNEPMTYTHTRLRRSPNLVVNVDVLDDNVFLSFPED